jgi:hypothetical protein
MSATVKYRVFHHERWIKTTVEGRLDLDQSLRMIRTLDDDPDIPAPFNLLIDLRNAPCVLTVTEVTEVVACMQQRWESFAKGRKIAVVVSDKPALDRAAFMELCARNRGFLVRAFTELDKARAWLEADASLDAASGASREDAGPAHPPG